MYDLVEDDINDTKGMDPIDISNLDDWKDVLYEGKHINEMGLLKYCLMEDLEIMSSHMEIINASEASTPQGWGVNEELHHIQTKCM